MKNLKFKILLTNVSRIIRSILFIDLSNIVLGISKVFALTPEEIMSSTEITCYAAGEPISIWDKNIKSEWLKALFFYCNNS